MRSYAGKPKETFQAAPDRSTYTGRTHLGQRNRVDSILHLQRTIGNEAVQELLQPRIQQHRLDSKSDTRLSADPAVPITVAGATIPGKSAALGIRDILRTSSLTHRTVQRVKTWGGEFTTDKYELTKDPGMNGVDIELRYKPGANVNAELIGMTQTARSLVKGSPVPTVLFGPAADKTLKQRTIPSGKVGAGTRTDRISTHGNPLYATKKPGAKDTLADTPTDKNFWGEHGWRYTDKAGKPQTHDALLKDTPQLPAGLKETSQVFETTALAVKGVQSGTFYGSVQWGWEKDAAGKVSKLPLKLVSKDVPSALFARASELWNRSKTSEGKETIDLPIVTGKYTNTSRVWLVSNPSKYAMTIIGKLAKNVRVEVTDKGAKQRFNKTADKSKRWKVTVVDGTHIGKVGWVMQTLLSDNKTK